MRHQRGNKKLGKPTDQRLALLKSLVESLFTYDRIKTTDVRAKEACKMAEKLITLGKKGDLSSRRKAMSILQDEKMTKKIFDTLADRYSDRNGGYTRIIKLGNRYGDNAPTAVIEFVDRDEEAKGLDSGPVIEKKTTEEEQLPPN